MSLVRPLSRSGSQPARPQMATIFSVSSHRSHASPPNPCPLQWNLYAPYRAGRLTYPSTPAKASAPPRASLRRLSPCVGAHVVVALVSLQPSHGLFFAVASAAFSAGSCPQMSSFGFPSPLSRWLLLGGCGAPMTRIPSFLSCFQFYCRILINPSCYTRGANIYVHDYKAMKLLRMHPFNFDPLNMKTYFEGCINL